MPARGRGGGPPPTRPRRPRTSATRLERPRPSLLDRKSAAVSSIDAAFRTSLLVGKLGGREPIGPGF
ncbi:hypothetical protein NL676_035062 [Syzygium grande]|nr:hypothetical protein NL676_035062 [Syzygium grande]